MRSSVGLRDHFSDWNSIADTILVREELAVESLVVLRYAACISVQAAESCSNSRLE